jgi:hypothetical protein
VSAVQFRPDRTTLAVALVILLGALPFALSSPYLAPAFLLPLGMVVWVLRARVAAGTKGLEICNGLGVRAVAWDDVDRFEIPKHGPVVLHSQKGATLRLTALSRRDLPAVLEASGN